MKKWYDEHPEEAKKEQASRKKWEKDRDKQFYIIYGIAKRHGLYLKWHGNDAPRCGDMWDIYKGAKLIGKIYC